MTLEENLSPAFQSLQGFHRLVRPVQVNEALTNLVDLSLREKGGFALEGCDSVRLLDTFFGFKYEILDSILKEMVSEGAPNFAIQILVVNPYSQLARARAQALADVTPDFTEDAFFETSKRLHNLIGCIGSATGRDLTTDLMLPKQDDEDPARVFRTLLSEFRKATEDLKIDIRFYDRPTEAPVYIISEFIFKGLLLDHRGASRNPWMIFVNDPSQPDDLYDRLSANFNKLWRHAARHPRAYRVQQRHPDTARSAFVIMSMDDEQRQAPLLELIRKLWDEHGITAHRADDLHTAEKRITDVMMNALVSADYVVCDLTGDRPNVYYEAGYAQALGKPVIFIAHADTVVHFDLRDYPITRYENLPDLEIGLRKRIRRLLERRSLEDRPADDEAEELTVDLRETVASSSDGT